MISSLHFYCATLLQSEMEFCPSLPDTLTHCVEMVKFIYLFTKLIHHPVVQ